MNNVLQQGNVDTACCKVRHDQELYMFSSESDKALLACALIHSAVNVHTLEACLGKQFMEVFNVVASCCKNDCLL